MRLGFRGRSGGRDRLLFTYQATVLTPIILLTTVSCSTLTSDLAECDLNSGLVTEDPRQLVLQREKAQKARREQANIPATPKVMPVRATNATSGSVPGDASKDTSKKASPRPRGRSVSSSTTALARRSSRSRASTCSPRALPELSRAP